MGSASHRGPRCGAVGQGTVHGAKRGDEFLGTVSRFWRAGWLREHHAGDH